MDGGYVVAVHGDGEEEDGDEDVDALEEGHGDNELLLPISIMLMTTAWWLFDHDCADDEDALPWAAWP